MSCPYCTMPEGKHAITCPFFKKTRQQEPSKEPTLNPPPSLKCEGCGKEHSPEEVELMIQSQERFDQAILIASAIMFPHAWDLLSLNEKSLGRKPTLEDGLQASVNLAKELLDRVVFTDPPDMEDSGDYDVEAPKEGK